MEDKELIGYCRIHCQTERALFSGTHINRIIALAGYPTHFVREVPPKQFFSMHEDMKELCDLAEAKPVQEISGACNVYHLPVREVRS